MRSINKVILSGNATRDAELRHTGSGTAVAGIRLATNRTVRGQEETQYHTIVCWAGLGETVHAHVKRGDPLYVEGRLQYRSFQDEEGRERMTTEIVASDVQFLGRRRDRPEPDLTPSGATGNLAAETSDVSPDEIPF